MATKKKNTKGSTKARPKPKAGNHKYAREIHSAAKAAVLAMYTTLDAAVAFSDDVDEAPKKSDLATLKKALVDVNKAVALVASAVERLST